MSALADSPAPQNAPEVLNAIVVLDIGKTNAKLCAVDALTGELITTATTQTRTIDTDPYPHLDTVAVWDWYLASLKQLQHDLRHVSDHSTHHSTHRAPRQAQKSSDQSRSAPRPHRHFYKIDSIVVTAHGATAALLNDDGLVLPVMDYEFAGLDQLRAEYNALCDPFEHTYSPELPRGLNLGRQLYWQRKHCAAQFSKAKYLVPYAQYWSWLLTGKAVAEVSTIGSHTDLWNPLQQRYSDFAQREDFASLFPKLAHASETLGPLSRDVQLATGIDKNCRVLVGIHDSNASLLPWITSRPVPLTVMSTGTWVIIFSVGTPLAGLQAERDCTANVTIHSEPVACARFMGGREYAAIACGEAASPTVADLLAVMQQGAIALPAFADAGGPYPGCVGSVQSESTLSAAQKHALASLYCALVSDESLTLCNSRGDIIVEGAFAKNELLIQCLAVFRDKQNVFASADTTGTTMGAALLATGVVTSNIDSTAACAPVASAQAGIDNGAASAAGTDDANADTASTDTASTDTASKDASLSQSAATGIPPPELHQATVSDAELIRKLLDYKSLWQQQVERHNKRQPFTEPA